MEGVLGEIETPGRLADRPKRQTGALRVETEQDQEEGAWKRKDKDDGGNNHDYNTDTSQPFSSGFGFFQCSQLERRFIDDRVIITFSRF